MTERKRDLLFLAGLLAVLVLLFSKILFTGRIVRAPDITNEFYWTVKGFKDMGFLELFKVSLRPTWDLFINSGTSEGGGTLSMQFLFYRNLIFRLLPAPANVAWFMVLHMFFGAAGTFLYCRAIGAGRFASFLGGLIFALAPENASLINAGHAQKIATISFAPWAFYFFEKGFQTRRVIFFLTAGFVLAFQFARFHDNETNLVGIDRWHKRLLIDRRSRLHRGPCRARLSFSYIHGGQISKCSLTTGATNACRRAQGN